MVTLVSEEGDSDSSSSSSADNNHSKTVCKPLTESPSLQSDSEFDQELSKEDIKELLNTNPADFKHCKLVMEGHDQAYARPLDDPTLLIKISGRENVGRSFPGDEVCVEIINGEQCPQESEVLTGRVVGLINRDEHSLTFICKMVEDSPKLVAPINKHMTRIRTVQTKPDKDIVELRQFKSGRWVKKEFVKIAENKMLVVKVIKWENGQTYPLGVVTKVISECDALDEMLDIEFGCKDTPPPLKLQDPEGNKALKEEDLYDFITFTIDPPKAEDLDGAISVREINCDRYQIGIHITDVASYISKDSEQDKFARLRGKTIYTPEKGDMTFMFSRDLSKDHLSLLPGKIRKAISLLVDVDKKTSNIVKTDFTETLIRSHRRMSYEEADQIIQKYCSDDIEPLRFSCVCDCLAVAYRFSEVHRKFRLEGGWPFGRQARQSCSHAMVEELMNLYNSAAAEKLISTDVTRDLTPLRCHREPDPEQLIQFKEKYVELIPMSPYFSNICEVDTDSEEQVWPNPQYENMEHNGTSFNIFTPIFQKMEEFAQSKDYYSLMQLIFSDEIHPTLIPMVWEFCDIQKKAVILRSCSSADSRLGHYDLRLNAYTWASSPMRRYLDLILQRLLHTMLSKEILRQPDYTQVEINGFCQSGMDAEEKHDALVLKLSKVQFEHKDVVKLAVVDQIIPQGNEFTILFPLHSKLDVITIMYKHLKVVDQPSYNMEKNSMTLRWKRRVYSFRESFNNLCPFKPMKNVTPVSRDLWKGLVSAVKQRDWVKIEQCLRDMKKEENEEKERNTSEDCSTEQRHYTELTMELKLGTVVQVQLGTELKDGFPVPVVQLLSVNQCFEICLEHTRNPIDCFSKTVCNASKPESYEEYQKIWSQLCHIDTAYNALEENNSVILEGVHITWSGDETNLQGFFRLTKTQKKQWCLEFDISNCFLCIRLRDQKRKKVENDAEHLDGSKILDLQGLLPFTWVAHAVTTKPKKQKNGDNQNKIVFQITKRSMDYIPPKFFDQGTNFTIEVIPQKNPYLLREHVIENLKQANDLVKNVTTNQQLNASADPNMVTLVSEEGDSDSSSSSSADNNHSKTVCKPLTESPSLQSDSEFDQELSKEDIKELLNTNPADFKHCKLVMEEYDQAYARPLDDPTLLIKISGRENVGRSFPGDEVCVEIINREQCPQESEVLTGRVVGLINRDEHSLTFICKMVEDSPKLVAPINKHMTRIRTVQTKPDKDIVELRQFKSGRWVKKEFVKIAENKMLVVKIIKWENGKTYPLGVVTKVISECDALDEMLGIEFGCKDPPPPLKLQDPEGNKALKEEVLYDFITFTIDPPKAEDLDDAISVREINCDLYQIGIHITDVASCISKNSEQDKFARLHGKTIYTPEKGDMTFMFSRNLSKDHLSLLPGKIRKAISLLVDVDKKTSNIVKTDFTETLIRSHRRMSYEEADQIIQKYCSDDTEPLRFSCVCACLAVAYRFSEVHRKFRLEGGWPFGRQARQSRSHTMVEELMNLYNSAAAEKLISTDVTRDLTPLRCHREPDPEQLTQFKEKYVELIPMSPNFSNIYQVCSNPEYDNMKHNSTSFNIFTSIFQKMEEFAQSKDYYSLMQLIFSDEIHPTLIPMVQEFCDIQKKAVILRSCSSADSRLGHYDLRLNAYTWASSPMRRYLDLILQRLLHTMLSKEILRQPDYTQVEINGFCQSGMDAEEKHDALVLKLSKFQSEHKDVVKLAVVNLLTPQGHEFTISFPLHSKLDVITIMYKHLKVVDQPSYSLEKNSMTLRWKRRVYSFRESFNNSYPFKPMKNVTPVSRDLWKGLVSAVQQRDWVKIEQCLRDMKKGENEEKERNTSEDCSTEQRHYKELTMELKLGTVVQVQLGTELKDGFPVPVVQLLSVNQCFEICLEHTRNPIDCFSKTVCNASKPFYESFEEYKKIWSQLCQIDTAYNALEENNSVILEGVHITWSGDETNLQGFFHLTKTQKKQWCLEFDISNCFLCIRLRDQKPKKVENDAEHLDGSEILDLQGSLPFTWVAHAVTNKPKEQKNRDNQKIKFKVTKTSMHFIPPRVSDQQMNFTIEVIPKKIPYLLREHVIENLKRANNLVKNVATRQHLKKLNANSYRNIVLDNVDESLNLPVLNESQQKAVEEAVKKAFTVIQGPPGTGKTVVGIHIVYQFFMKNQDFLTSYEMSKSSKSIPDAKRPKKPAILYCGPSNKSVDIVAELYKEVRNILQVCYTIYNTIYLLYCDDDKTPFPREWDITLMYLVREPENTLSEQIKNFEKHNLLEDEIDTYRETLKKAHKEEIQKYDVVLCTCSTALKPEILAVMDFHQIIIDECAMATEPEAFIPLVSYNPRQIVLLGDHQQIRPIVQCALVRKMGMQQSLFERYMDLAVMLDTQYRMHEEICRFPSKEFYKNKLKTGAERGPCYLLKKNGKPTAILFGHMQGKEDSLVVSTKEGNENSVANIKEAKQAVRVANLLIKQAGVEPEHIAILTPYNAQVSEIKKIIEKNKDLANVSVCTIMKSQGSEWPYVIVSTVRSCSISEIESDRPSKAWLGKRLGFITDPNQIGGLEHHYHFHHSRVVRRSTFATRGAHSFIHMDPKVDWAQQQVVKTRVKRHVRSDPSYIHFNDPKWSNMWYIHCSDKNSRCRSEMNILAAWQRGYTGRNVVVTILDDGIERNHPDLAQNYDQLASYDVNGNDYDPTPRYDSSNENKHGTRCAGEVAAVANNSHCIVGIAYNARIGGVRMLDGDVTDVVEAKSLGIRPDYIDIYSASWGPDDDGKTVDGPGPLAKQAFELGIKKGRKGLGSIFVWASGNGGRQGDHCSCDGYTNSIYTISVSSSTENGNKPWYLEVTTDLRQRCTDGHTGTSVSAPMVAGVIALALEANPLITWRDVQHLLVKTSRQAHLKASDWKTNAAGHKVSHLYGFGLVDAEAMVVEAKKWRNVPPQHTCSKTSDRRTRYIRADQKLNASISSSGCSDQPDQQVLFLEHVVVRVLIVHPRRGDLEISLISPSGTRSQLLAQRLFDNSNEGFRNWEFMTVHCWGERAEGTWTLEISDSPSQLRNPEVLGKLKEWTLILHGTAEHPYQSQGSQHSRSRMLEIPTAGKELKNPDSVPGAPEHEEEEEEEYNGPCHPECGDQGCDGPDADHCLNCIHFSLGSLKTGRTCVSYCPLGYFEDGEARRCRRCHRGCEKCVGRGSNKCQSCRRGLYFYSKESACVETCPAGHFNDDGQRRCQKCHENCWKCLRDADRCTACKDGFRSRTGGVHSVCAGLLTAGVAVRPNLRPRILQRRGCGIRTEDVPQKCENTHIRTYTVRCEEHCLSCQGPGTSCTQCKDGYSLVSRTCIVNATCNNAAEMVKLTAELIEQAAQYTNPVRDRELDLRGYKIPVLENLGATLDQFDTIDLSDNEVRKLDGFPLLKRLKTLLLNNNRICRIGENLEQSLPNLKELILTSNNIQELGDLDPLATVKSLTLLRNPVTNKKHYRLYVINKIPQIRVLDFQKVKLKERQEAEKMFKGKRGAQLAKDIAKRTKTFTPGAALQTEKKTGPSAADVEAIKNAIANATSLAEVERLKGLLQSGQIPGRELRSGASNMVEEEEEIQEEMQESVPMYEDMQGAEGENGGDDDMQEDVHMNGS
ncbi:pro convertase subtilisin kexin type 6 isoform X1 [Labeo rohita]|uniref:Pro convertase subtilisin kexin type 6 isoform X1 n=1 Tax=Labeo rohita TaxID=84645 RepID=A0A498MMG4_LABRO|nr:pro convertase subtilisin kexin type 6 isoform X1 [Labeo rohita]